jgi:membrane protein insertase Oxa1/YidC/SpoIIIJ
MPKNFAMPIIWAWFAPVFSVTSAALIKLQALTAIPWLPFIIISGVSVRLMIVPLMIRQMTLVNKMSRASPNIRLATSLFKHSKMPFHKRLYYLAAAIYNFQK